MSLGALQTQSLGKSSVDSEAASLALHASYNCRLIRLRWRAVNGGAADIQSRGTLNVRSALAVDAPHVDIVGGSRTNQIAPIGPGGVLMLWWQGRDTLITYLFPGCTTDYTQLTAHHSSVSWVHYTDYYTQLTYWPWSRPKRWRHLCELLASLAVSQVWRLRFRAPDSQMRTSS